MGVCIKKFQGNNIHIYTQCISKFKELKRFSTDHFNEAIHQRWYSNFIQTWSKRSIGTTRHLRDIRYRKLARMVELHLQNAWDARYAPHIERTHVRDAWAIPRCTHASCSRDTQDATAKGCNCPIRYRAYSFFLGGDHVTISMG